MIHDELAAVVEVWIDGYYEDATGATNGGHDTDDRSIRTAAATVQTGRQQRPLKQVSGSDVPTGQQGRPFKLSDRDDPTDGAARRLFK